MTFSDGNTIEKETMLGDRVLNYLYVLADRYYAVSYTHLQPVPPLRLSGERASGDGAVGVRFLNIRGKIGRAPV